MSHIADFLRENTAVRKMLSEVFCLIRLFLITPVTTCIAERSFSVIRRLKTYLRSTVGQMRLNDLAILHCYKERTYEIVVDNVYTEFIGRNELRQKTFEL